MLAVSKLLVSFNSFIYTETVNFMIEYSILETHCPHVLIIQNS